VLEAAGEEPEGEAAEYRAGSSCAGKALPPLPRTPNAPLFPHTIYATSTLIPETSTLTMPIAPLVEATSRRRAPAQASQRHVLAGFGWAVALYAATMPLGRPPHP